MILPQQLRQALQALTLNFPSSSWDEVLTASNAAIGGPSTAAAFAMGLASSSGRINNDDDKNNDIVGNCSRRREEQHRSALVIGATVWGVFGYAIATGAYECQLLFLLNHDNHSYLVDVHPHFIASHFSLGN